MQHPSLQLSIGDQHLLLQLARSSVQAVCMGQDPPPLPTDAPAHLHTGAAAFVTLYREGQLRGCIGTFDNSTPLLNNIVNMAEAAALRDPRFPPVSAEELPHISLAISVLTPPIPIDDIEKIIVGTHGIVISQGHRRGVLLAKVAVEQRWDRDTFLEQTCRKAGLLPQAWHRFGYDPTLSIAVFQELSFAEET